MTFDKPCRIFNKTTPAMLSQAPPVTASFKEIKGRYELRIRISDAKEHNYTIVITEGILCVYEKMETEPQNNRVLYCLTLPANILQDQVRAFRRNYGLKIVMPKASLNGIVVVVPLIDEKTKH